MKKQIETERLVMREFNLSDAEGLFELDSNPEVLKFIGIDTTKAVEESENLIKDLQQQYAENGIARWAVIEKGTDEFMGWSGLKLYRGPVNNQTNIYELGYRFLPKFWDKGFATETAHAWVKYAFEELKVEKLFAITDLEHANSKNVLNKVGFKNIEIINYHGDDVNWLEVTKEEWKVLISQQKNCKLPFLLFYLESSMKKKLLFILFYLIAFCAKAQVISSTNYPMQTTPSGAFLEDMTSGVVAIGSGQVTVTAPPVAFGNGFQFVLNSIVYDSITINSRGIVRLGSETGSVMFSTNKAEIAPLYGLMNTGTNGAVKYKLTGTFPNRKFVVHWQVKLQSSVTSNSAIHGFQLWLHEKGKIEFVYGNTPTSWNGSYSQSYQSGFTYANYNERVQVNIHPTFTSSTAVYGVGVFNETAVLPFESKITFAPDSNFVNPPLVSFGQIGAACMELNIIDTTRNEIGIKVFRSDDGTNYNNMIANISTVTLDSGTIYNVLDTGLNDQTTYYYAVSAYNLSTLPDTVYLDSFTTSPQLSGVKTIPGDYNSITDALQDIKCKQIASDLYLELNNSYNPINETFPIVVNEEIWTGASKQLTIRPAIGASNIVINNLVDTSMFIISHGQYFNIDGRSGGLGSTQEITLKQDSSAQPIMVLKDSSTNNTLRYCMLMGQGKDDNLPQCLLYFDSISNSNNSVEFCDFSPLAGEWIEFGVLSEGSVVYPNSNNTISNCDFEDFGSQYLMTNNGVNSVAAIKLLEGNSGWKLLENSFYFSDTLNTMSTDFISVTSPNGSGFEVKGNSFGGSAPLCNGGRMEIVTYGKSYDYGVHYIELIADSINQNIISGNKIKNIQFIMQHSGNFDRYDFISVRSNNVLVDSNIVGDSLVLESVKYVAQSSVVSEMEVFEIKRLNESSSNIDVVNNSIYGISVSGYKLAGINFSSSYMELDRAVVENNIIGGPLSENIFSSGGFYGIRTYFHGEDTVFVSNNVVRNVKTSGDFFGIYVDVGTSSPYTPTHVGLIIENNLIYNAKSGGGSAMVAGIYVSSKRGEFLIKNNEIHSLVNTQNSGNGWVYGIGAGWYQTSGFAQIKGNYIHNIYTKIINGDVFGIRTHMYADIENNMIALGNDENGNVVLDSADIYGIYIEFSIYDSTLINHNSIYITGDTVSSSYADGACLLVNRSSSSATRNAIVTNNIFASNRFHNLIEYSTVFGDQYIAYCDYNQYYSGKSGPFGKWGLTFSEWQNDWGMDTNSFFRPPMFIDPEGGAMNCDLHLHIANYAEERGRNSGLIEDIDNDVRLLVSPVDIGADAGEFHQIPIIELSGDVTICISDSIMLSAGAYSQYDWSTGDTTEMIMVDTTGLYSLTVYDSLGYSDSDSVYITVDTLVPNFSSIVDATMCVDDTIALSTVGGFSFYSWSTGDSTSSISVTIADAYVVTVGNSNNCMFYDTVQVSLDSLYNYSFSNMYGSCADDSVLVVLSPNGFSFNWGSGIVNDSVILFPNTTNIVEVNSPFGCVKNDTIVIESHPLYNVNANSIICSGDSLILGGDYQLVPGIYYDTLQSLEGCDSVLATTLIINSPVFSNQNIEICEGDSALLEGSYQYVSGSYQDTLLTVLGCDSILVTTLISNPSPNVSLDAFVSDTLCYTDNAIQLPLGTPSGGVYSGLGVSSFSFDPDLAGVGNHNILYTFTDLNFCANSDSTDVFVDLCVTNAEESFLIGMLVYPNPSSGKFLITKLSPNKSNIVVDLLDVNLKIIKHSIFFSGETEFMMDISKYSKGVYYLKLVMDENFVIKKIVKN